MHLPQLDCFKATGKKLRHLIFPSCTCLLKDDNMTCKMDELPNEILAKIFGYLPQKEILQLRRLSSRCAFIIHDYHLVKKKELSIKFINMLGGCEAREGQGKTSQGGLTLGCILGSNDTDGFALTISPGSAGHAVWYNSKAKPQLLINAYYRPDEPDVSLLLEKVLTLSPSIKQLNVNKLWDDEMVDIFLTIFEKSKCKVENVKIESTSVAKAMKEFRLFEKISANNDGFKVFMDSCNTSLFLDELIELASFTNLILQTDSERVFINNIKHLIEHWFDKKLTSSFIIECDAEPPNNTDTAIMKKRNDERLRCYKKVKDLPTSITLMDETSDRKLLFTIGHRKDQEDGSDKNRTVLSFRDQ